MTTTAARLATFGALSLVLAACSSSPAIEPDPSATSTTATSTPTDTLPTMTETASAPAPPTVPDLLGATVTQAAEMLAAIDVAPTFIEQSTQTEVDPSTGGDRLVMSTYPDMGDPLPADGTLDVFLYDAPDAAPAGLQGAVTTALADEPAVTSVEVAEGTRVRVFTSLEDPRGDDGSPAAVEAIRICEAAVAAAAESGFQLVSLTVMEADETSWILWGHPSVPAGVCTEV